MIPTANALLLAIAAFTLVGAMRVKQEGYAIAFAAIAAFEIGAGLAA